MRYKPSFILLDIAGENEGIRVLHEYFVEKKGFEFEYVRTLVVKYPYILGKKPEEFEAFFT
jgi:hypothetical protein